jgi:multicomponent Na+:H+ antiporter subunit F
MTGLQICAIALIAGGLGPTLVLASTRDPANRLIGVQLAATVVVIVMLVMSVISRRSYDLIVPLVLVPLAFAGTLVFTRLLSGSDEQ